ncbi:hypothetical protein ACFE04_013362 [Oxalis oulophora]
MKVEFVEVEKEKHAVKIVEGEALVNVNKVNLADNEDITRHLYEVDSDGVIVDIHEDEVSDGYDNFSHEDSDEDDKLQSARIKLRASAKVSKVIVTDGLLFALKVIHSASIDLRTEQQQTTSRRRVFNDEDDVGSEYNYET